MARRLPSGTRCVDGEELQCERSALTILRQESFPLELPTGLSSDGHRLTPCDSHQQRVLRLTQGHWSSDTLVMSQPAASLAESVRRVSMFSKNATLYSLIAS